MNNFQEHDGRHALSQLVHSRTYAAVKSDGKKESRDEVVQRVEDMHKMLFSEHDLEITRAFDQVRANRAVPSMRSMQFGGYAIMRSNARIYNCAYAPLTEWKDFADLFWLLMNGVGVGYSVQERHISQLPIVTPFAPEPSLFVVPDTKEGWADAVLAILENPLTQFDVSKVRAKGSRLSTGGTCSGPESLVTMLENIRSVLVEALGRQLRPIQAFDIMCYIADIVVAGSVRRAATIALFSDSDEEMLTAKQGDFWNTHPWRQRANISVVLERKDPEIEHKMRRILAITEQGGAGEPGISLTNNPDMGFNPCQEIALRPRGLCNLTEVNVASCYAPQEFFDAVEAATIIGTLQATYTDFEYLHPDWSKNAREEALLGVSLTGQAENWGLLTDEVLEEGATIVLEVNQEWAEKLGINPAARATTVKPSGNTSAWLGTTSGIHAAHAEFYLRRARVDRKSEFGHFLIQKYGEQSPESGSFIEADKFNTENIVLTIPVRMSNSIYRADETAIGLLERMKHVYSNWVMPGHVEGANTHNVSLTVNYHPHEFAEIVEWMVANRSSWAGISLLPYHGGNYPQMPFEEISESEFYAWLGRIPSGLDFSEIDFSNYVDERVMELACAGGSCEVV